VSSIVAVVGVSSAVGRACLARLAGPDGPDQVIAVGPDGPDMPPGRVEVRMMDPRDRLLPLALDGVDVVVHCASSDDAATSADDLYGINVGGTRNVLAAASKAGARHLVVISDAVVYGAHPDNPLPIPETAPMRANPGYAYGYQRQLAEEMVAEWAQAHPDTTVTVLRTAPVLGGGVDGALVRRLQGVRLVVPTGLGAPWQFVHVDDVASATALVIAEGIGGTFNVAADGWLGTDEVATYLGRRVQEVPRETLAAALHHGHDLGVSPLPGEAMPYLLEPWVIDNDALRRHGWHAARSNRELLAAFAAEHADDVAFGNLVVSRAGVRTAAVGASALLVLALWRAVRGDR
jgi:UDP-glucose 4-epimerase